MVGEEEGDLVAKCGCQHALTLISPFSDLSLLFLSFSECLALSVRLSPLTVYFSPSLFISVYLSLYLCPPLTVLPSLSLTKTNEQYEESAIFLQAITLEAISRHRPKARLEQ